MNQIFLGEPAQEIKNWFVNTYLTGPDYSNWPTYTTLKFVDGTTETKEIYGTATWQNIGVKSDEWSEDNTLTYCQIGKNITEIINAFRSCHSLTSIDIPNSLSSIGEYALSGCISLPSVNIPSSVTSIGYGAFQQCHSLTSINIPNSVTSIGDRAFQYCSSLISVNISAYIPISGAISDSLIKIGEQAFYHCQSLTSINIPNSVTSIGDRAFQYCYSLTLVNISAYIPISGAISDSLIKIGEQAFYHCQSLTSINIPNSVTSIGSEAFAYCSSLTSIVFEGRTMSQIRSMANYPWDIPNTSTIVPGIS